MKKIAQTQAKQIKRTGFLLFSMILFTLTFFVLHSNLFGSQGAQNLGMGNTSILEHFHCDTVTNDPQSTPGTNHLKCKMGVVNAPAAQLTPTPTPAAAPASPNSVVLFDDNTSTQYAGWSTQRKETVDMPAPYNLKGQIIGRIGPNELVQKNFILPTEMKQYFRVSFLFLKIGSPDDELVQIFFNNTSIIFQPFNLYRDDPIKAGGEIVSVPFEPFSNKPLIFNPQWNAQPWPGQVMAVSMVFKKDGNNMVLLKRDGSPTSLKFPLTGNQFLFQLRSGLNEPIENEAFGLMDLKGETFDTLDPTQIIPKLPTSASTPATPPVAAPAQVPTAAPATPNSVVLVKDSQYQGWTSSLGRPVPTETVDMGSPYNLHGTILGRLNPKETVSKTYILPGEIDQYLQLKFLFLKIGSPDNERATFSINSIPIIAQNFWLYRDDPIMISGQIYSVPFEPFSNKVLVFNPQWNTEPWPGQVMAVNLVFKRNGTNMVLLGRDGNPTTVSFPLNGNQLTLRFESGLDEPIINEAFALKDLEVNTLKTLDPAILTPKLPQ